MRGREKGGRWTGEWGQGNGEWGMGDGGNIPMTEDSLAPRETVRAEAGGG